MGEEMVGGKKSCCQNPANLTLIEQRADIEVRRCSICQCRHFELTVDAGSLGLKMAEELATQPGA